VIFIPAQNWPTTGAAEAPAPALATADGLLDELHALTTNRTPATNAGSRR
jgi:hypothetical protein